MEEIQIFENISLLAHKGLLSYNESMSFGEFPFTQSLNIKNPDISIEYLLSILNTTQLKGNGVSFIKAISVL